MIVKLYLVVCNLSGEGGRGRGGGGEKKTAGERRVHTMVLQGGRERASGQGCVL